MAVTLVPVVELNPVPGLQVYIDAPVAVSVAEEPTHRVAELTVTVGKGFTVTTKVAELTHPATLVPVTV